MPGQGVTSKAAFKIETGAWGASIALGAGNQIHFMSESVSPQHDQESSVVLDGNAGQKTVYPTMKKVQGDVLVEAHYAAIESLLICTFGMSHQDNSPVAVTTTTYQHWFELSNDMSERAFNGYEMETPSGNAIRRGTLGFEKDTSVWENVSTMFNSVAFEASPERVQWTFTVAAYDLDFDTGTNPNSSAWTFPDGSQVLWDDMIVYLKPRDVFTIGISNDTLDFNETGTATVHVADGTYTGYELAQAIAYSANLSGSLAGVYKAEYDEESKRFRFFTTDGTLFIVESTGDMNATVGFSALNDSPDATSNKSMFDAIADAYAAFDSGDQVGVSSISWSNENQLDIESQDSESSLRMIEPERNDMRRITGQIEIPRYSNDDFIKAVNGFTTYEMHIKFTGAAIDSENEEYNMYFPAIKFITGTAPVGGPNLITQTLGFEAQEPTFLDLENFYFQDFSVKAGPDSAAAQIHSMGKVGGKIFGGGDGGLIVEWDGTSWSTTTDVGSGIIYAFAEFKGKGYCAGDGEQVYQYDPVQGEWATNTDLSGDGNIMAMKVFNDELYLTTSTTGKVYKTASGDTDDWSTSTDTAAADMHDLEVYNGNLYAIGGDDTTFLRIWITDTGDLDDWSISCDFGGINVADRNASFALHRGQLYCHYNNFLNWFNDDSLWVELGTHVSMIDIKSWKGNLMMLPSGGGQDLYYWDFATSTDINVDSSLNLTTHRSLYFLGDKLVMPQGAGFSFLESPHELLMNVQSQLTSNPL